MPSCKAPPLLLKVISIRTFTFNFTVQTVSGSSKYFLNGGESPILELLQGHKYIFTFPSGHPLKLSTEEDGGARDTTMVMTHFYQRNVFESCLKISARLRAEILQIRVKTGHFGVKMGITISSSRALSAARAERPRFSGLPGPESCRSPRGPKPERRERQIYLQGAGREGTPVRL